MSRVPCNAAALLQVCNLIRQQKELLGAEGVTLEFEDAAIREMARVATLVNRTVEVSVYRHCCFRTLILLQVRSCLYYCACDC
jgi:ATP-dependent protease HslVU (ClpYQ) ATPase subunit